MSIKLSFPLSPAQTGIWLGQQKLANNPCYNTAEMLHFEGQVDVVKLISSIAVVLQNTAALNVLFEMRNDALLQRYCPNNGLTLLNGQRPRTLLVPDKTAIIEAAPSQSAANPTIFQFSDDNTLAEWQRYWLSEVIDLTKERPFRHALIERPNGSYSWFLQIHHIACDGLSYALISKALKQAYETASEIQPNQEQASLVAYQALIETAVRYEQSEQRLDDKTYWLSQFRTHNPLSFKKSALSNLRPAIGCRHSVQLSPGFFETIKIKAGSIHHDWPSLLKAALCQWLYHCTGETVITLGCPDMNRPFGPAMRQPGLQMNIMPLTVCVNKKDSLTDIAIQIQSLKRSHKPHNRYRYENFASDLKSIPDGSSKTAISSPSSNVSPRRPFGPMINILPFDRRLNISDCTLRVSPLSAGPVEDIAIYFWLNDYGELECFIECHPELYQKDEGQWLSANLAKWLNSSINPEPQPCNTKELLNASEECLSKLASPKLFDCRQDRHGSADDPNQTEIKNVFCLLEQQRKLNGNKQALRWLDQTSTESSWQCIDYQTLCTYIADAAQTLAQAGLRKSQKCIIASGRDPWSIVSMFACLALNAEFIGVDIDGPDERLQTIIDDCHPRLLLLNQGDWLSNKNITLPRQTQVITTEEIARHARQSRIATANAMSLFSESVSPLASAYSVYTSGSTGRPKAVQISQQALVDFVVSANSVYQITDADHVLQFAPLHFDACIEEIFISLCHGASLTLRSEAMMESFGAFNESLLEQGITVLDLPTAFWHEWVRFNKRNNNTLAPSLSRVIIGGEACQQTAVADFFAVKHRVKLINTYGPSEATVVTTAKVLSADTWKSAHPSTIGSPLPGRTVYILGDDLKPLPKGIAGQLAIAGDSLATGYFAQPELTAKQFITRPFFAESERLYLSGDIAAINALDEVIFYGRTDDEIKIAGQRIHPAEITAAIESLLPDHQVAVISIKRENQYHIYAAVAHERYSKWQAYEKQIDLKKALGKTLPRVQIPSAFFSLPKLPLTSTGKIDKKQLTSLIHRDLQKPAAESDKSHYTDDNATHVLKHVVAVWKEVLGIAVVLPTDDFFVLGGTSLQLLQVATRLNEILALGSAETSITVSDLFQYPRAYDLANAIAHHAKSQKPSQIKATSFSPPDLPVELKIKFRKSPRLHTKPHIFLTGATGFVGIHLLNTLLNNASNTTKVSCLVRAQSEIQARNKILNACKQQGLPDISQHKGLSIVLGDLAQADWGLSHHELLALAKPLTAIIHNAAVTSVVRDYQSLKAINVDATLTALKLAHLAGSTLHYISTIAVGGDAPLPENYIPLHADLLDGYQQSKWASEKLLQQRADLGQPICIYRLPRVVGTPDLGTINPKDLIWQIAAASQRAGVLPQLAFQEPWLAVNDVANFVSARIFDQSCDIYNCVPDEAVSIGVLLDTISQLCNLQQIPTTEWLSAISKSTHSEDQALFAFFKNLKQHKEVLPEIHRSKFVKDADKNALQAPPLDAYIKAAAKLGLIKISSGNNTPSEVLTMEGVS